MAVYNQLYRKISTLNVGNIPQERKDSLKPLVDFIQQKIEVEEEIRINFICTHNSRRSHLSQVWAQTFAYFFKIKNIFCYSGGSEATALSPMIATNLESSGFKVKPISESKNPVYSIKFSENQHPIIGFSKTFDNDFNPKSTFAAIMTCSQADEGCPFISGAEKRFSIPYEDPKIFDNTPEQAEKYNEINLKIATEMLYVFSQINSKNGI